MTNATTTVTSGTMMPPARCLSARLAISVPDSAASSGGSGSEVFGSIPVMRDRSAAEPEPEDCGQEDAKPGEAEPDELGVMV